MTPVDVRFLASSPTGDMPLGPGELARPFRISPKNTHPFLTLGDYLEGLRDFVLQDEGRPLCRALSDRSEERVLPEDLRSIHIRTEKHGTLYHVACVEAWLRSRPDPLRLCASTAVSETAKRWLTREVETLEELRRIFASPFLPEPLCFGPAVCGSGAKTASVLVLLADWFEGFHEWHLENRSPEGPSSVRIWDQARGYCWATREEARSLFRGASRILTLTYDPAARRQIRAWHHAAGDFVVRPRNGSVEVRLTTARRYAPLPGLGPDSGLHPAVSLVPFFLDTVLRMRLDKDRGVGDALWAGDEAVQGAVAGFLDGAAERTRAGKPILQKDIEIFRLLGSFSREELQTLHEPVLRLMEGEDPSDRALVQERLADHVTLLHRVLRGVRG